MADSDGKETSALSAFINATSHTMMPKPGATHSTARDASEPIRRRNLLLQTSRPPASQVLAPESSSPGMGGGFLKPGEHGGVVRPPFFSSLGSALRPSSYGSPFGAAFGDPLQTGNLRIGGSSIESSTRPAPSIPSLPDLEAERPRKRLRRAGSIEASSNSSTDRPSLPKAVTPPSPSSITDVTSPQSAASVLSPAADFRQHVQRLAYTGPRPAAQPAPNEGSLIELTSSPAVPSSPASNELPSAEDIRKDMRATNGIPTEALQDDSSPVVVRHAQMRPSNGQRIIGDDEDEDRPAFSSLAPSKLPPPDSSAIDLTTSSPMSSPVRVPGPDAFQRYLNVNSNIPHHQVRAAWVKNGGDLQKATAVLFNVSEQSVQRPTVVPSHRGPIIGTSSPLTPVVHPVVTTKLVTRQVPIARTALPPAIMNRVAAPPHAAIPLPYAPHTLTPVAVAAPAPKKLVRRRNRSESDEDAYSDEAPAYDERSERDRYLKEADALKFFNECQVGELPDTTACTLAQANLVISLRPFESVDALRTKLRKAKGVSPNLFDSFVEIVEAYQEVDRVFKECADVGRELSSVMRIWSGVASRSASQAVSASASTSRAPTPDVDTGLHLTKLDETAFAQFTQANASDDVKEAFNDYLSTQPKALPEGVLLKGYQLLGVNWLNLLYRKGHSCILADEMGLGKTAQVIAFLAHLKQKGESGPHLIIVPSSTLDNWLREFKTFAPTMNVESYYGSQAERYEMRHDLRSREDLDVVVTTYNMAAGGSDDRKFLRKMEFRTCTYDEGHQLKNAQSKKYTDLMQIKVPWRLLLTGTPLQNNLTELISLLSFILPHIFGSAKEDLRAIFKVPAEAQANQLSQKRINAAKNVMTPFILRRKKMQVLTDLPEKRERIEFCEMTLLQKQVYREAMLRSRRAILEADGSESQQSVHKTRATKKGTVRPSESSSANVLMDLRKAANHPMLFRRLFDDKKIRTISRDCLRELEFMDSDQNMVYEDLEVMTDFELHRFVHKFKHLKKHALKKDEWLQAGKVAMLRRLLPDMLAQGDRILLFSQFTQVLDILESVLDTMGVRYLKLTGQTNVGERQALIDKFSVELDIGVFLLSTRAGGLGLNLAAANVVILYDQDFNPHNDKQAEDRAWRIGQMRDVSVIRLITRDTIEEDIYALAQTKLLLDKHVSVANDETTRDLAGAPGIPSSVSRVMAGGSASTGTNTPTGSGTPLGEGDEGLIEKRMAKSLLSKLREKLQDEDGDISGSQPAPIKAPASPLADSSSRDLQTAVSLEAPMEQPT